MTPVPALTKSPRTERRFWFGLTAILFLVGVAAPLLIHGWISLHRGDPDPGHRRINALRPVLTAVPADARINNRAVVKPQWDSCDGKHHGWNPATVDIGFHSSLSQDAVLAHITAALRSMGWTYEPNSQVGAWYWHKSVEGSTAYVQLLGGPSDDPPDWDLQALTAAATHALNC